MPRQETQAVMYPGVEQIVMNLVLLVKIGDGVYEPATISSRITINNSRVIKHISRRVDRLYGGHVIAFFLGGRGGSALARFGDLVAIETGSDAAGRRFHVVNPVAVPGNASAPTKSGRSFGPIDVQRFRSAGGLAAAITDAHINVVGRAAFRVAIARIFVRQRCPGGTGG